MNGRMPRRCREASISWYRRIAAPSQTPSLGSMRLHSTESRSAFTPSCSARSKSVSALRHQSMARSARSPDRMRPSLSHCAHWLLQMPPSTWWAEVATPQRKSCGNGDLCAAPCSMKWSLVHRHVPITVVAQEIFLAEGMEECIDEQAGYFHVTHLCEAAVRGVDASGDDTETPASHLLAQQIILGKESAFVEAAELFELRCPEEHEHSGRKRCGQYR